MSHDAIVHDEIGWGDGDHTPAWGPAQSLLLIIASVSVWLPSVLAYGAVNLATLITPRRPRI